MSNDIGKNVYCVIFEKNDVGLYPDGRFAPATLPHAPSGIKHV